MYLKKQIFFVLGLSRSGEAVAKYLLGQGSAVYIYDDSQGERIRKTVKELIDLGAKEVKQEDVSRMETLSDALVLSPGIPIDHPVAVAFKKARKAVLGEAEIAARRMLCPIIALTGTNGKTTTVSMLTDVLNRGGFVAKACGNIGIPMVEFSSLREEVAVAEISSFQLETLNSLRPHIAMILNIEEDHLNRHYTMENYVFLKGKLLKNMTETEYAVLNYDDDTVRNFAEHTKANVLYFSVKERVKGGYLENGTLFFGKEKIMAAEDLFAEGIHNVQNALACIVAAKIMGVKTADIVAALTDFKGIKHRVEKVAEVGGVEYIDDSKGTNVAATLKAIEMMKNPTILLLGGKNKGYDYRKLFTTIKNSKITHAVLYGENRYALLKSSRECGFDGITLCDEFDFAVRIAAMKAKMGQTVLLSPASASFDQFASYEERGDRFVEIVRSFERETVAEEGKETDDVEDNDGDME